jgi:hypothetical protein
MDRNRPMPRWLRAWCWLVLRLDYIPRYGRLYVWDSRVTPQWSKVEWKWSRRGHWGLNLLDDFDLFEWYTNTLMARVKADEYKAADEREDEEVSDDHTEW